MFDKFYFLVLFLKFCFFDFLGVLWPSFGHHRLSWAKMCRTVFFRALEAKFWKFWALLCFFSCVFLNPTVQGLSSHRETNEKPPYIYIWRFLVCSLTRIRRVKKTICFWTFSFSHSISIFYFSKKMFEKYFIIFIFWKLCYLGCFGYSLALSSSPSS